ncbi:SHOCT domain-containing protein [Cryocola sp. 340MFSha3.1]|uniref:SHOCT domain-containing protein n=1 Tax=Cryocola sp. 340MFSha3.1 TaxID=1169145 RepID=UPI001E2B133F|nr:SHOCT domain-containing protein [Cryocola sp. 340MFSha3.1]
MPLRRMGRPGLIGMAARTAVVAGTATAVAGGVQHHQQQKYQNQYEQEQYEQQQAAQQAQEAQAQQEAAAQQAAAQQAAAQQAAAQQQAAPADDLMTRLQQLATLHTQGVLTDEEFSAAKAKLLT